MPLHKQTNSEKKGLTTRIFFQQLPNQITLQHNIFIT